MSIGSNIASVRERIEAAARRRGGDAGEVALMCVTKAQPSAAILEAYEAGARLFGENRVQEFEKKREDLSALAGAEFRLIGHLQSNKAVKAAQLFDAIDSLDSLRTAEKLNQACCGAGKVLPVLIEINTGAEAAKSGLGESSGELETLVQAIPIFENLVFRGLMTIPPYAPEPEAARVYFRALRGLRDRIAARSIAGSTWETLSMGMSHDFEVAVEEGATCVRVGTAIFGERCAGDD